MQREFFLENLWKQFLTLGQAVEKGFGLAFANPSTLGTVCGRAIGKAFGQAVGIAFGLWSGLRKRLWKTFWKSFTGMGALRDPLEI